MRALRTFDGLNTITRRGSIGTSIRSWGCGRRARPCADDEGAEGGQLHRLARGQAVADLVEHALDKRRRFGPRQTDLLVDGLAQIGPRHRLPAIAAPSAIEFQQSRRIYLNRNANQSGRTGSTRVPANRPDENPAADPHQRISAAPQVKPPPIASIMTRSPCLMRPSLARYVERQRDRGGRGVAVLVDGDHHLLGRDAELLGAWRR